MSLRAFLDEAFGGEFTEEDWQHCLGGSSILVSEGDAIVAHAAVVPRTLFAGGRRLRCGYVEGVAVRSDRRGRGLGAAAMAAAERIVAASYQVGALGSTEAALGFYDHRGWIRWRGPLFAGPDRTADDEGSVFVLPLTTTLDITAALTCEPRPGDPW